MSNSNFGKTVRDIVAAKELRLRRSMETAGEAKKCHCGSPMILRKNNNGARYWVCTTHRGHMMGYVNYDNPIKTCPKCYCTMSLRQGRYGDYWSCSNFTECRHTESYVPPENKDGGAA